MLPHIRTYLLTLVLVAVALPAWKSTAAPLKLLFGQTGTPRETIEATLVAIPLATSSGDQSSLPEQAVLVPGDLTLELGDNTVWRFELRATGYWNEPVTVTPGQRDEAVLMLHPTTAVRGILQLAEESEEIPPSVCMRFVASATRDREDTGIGGEVECPVGGDGSFMCQVPVGTFDLRARLDGFISHYFWEKPLEHGSPFDLGVLDLAPGSSLVGWVSTEDRALLGESCTATLLPQGTEEANSTRRETVLVDKRGFFHFEGLAPGNYRLVAKKPGYAPAPVDNILVFPGLEANLRETLVLHRPLEPTFLISPTTDLADKPWRLELLTTGTFASHVALGSTDPEGRFRPGGIAAGKYNLRVIASDGTKVASEEILLEPRAVNFSFEIPTVWVEGRITFGGEPLAARLDFGGSHGEVSIPIVSDDEGRFSGSLPRDGDWAVDIRAREPKIFRRLRHVEVRSYGSTARLDLDLPNTLLEVEVVGTDGEPVVEATVFVALVAKEEDSETPAPGRTDEEGIYEVQGVAYGDYRLEAHSWGANERLVSEPVVAALSEGSPSTTVRLILRRQKVLRGRVVSMGGAGIQGVSVHAVTPEISRGLLVPQDQTGRQGEFELFFSSEAEHATLYAMSPGSLLAVQEVKVSSEHQPTISLQQSGGGELFLRFSNHFEAEFGIPRFEVLHDGRPWMYAFLIQWALANGVHLGDQVDVSIPAMPVGHYRVCFKKKEKVIREFCDDGLLAVGGRLELFAGKESRINPTTMTGAMPEKEKQ